MIRSIRSFLSVSILSGVIVIMLLTVAINYAFIHKRFRKNMDGELSFVAHATQSFLDDNRDKTALTKLQDFLEKLPYTMLEKNNRKVAEYFYLQVLDAKDNLVIATNGMPQKSLTNKLGFDDILQNGIFWRVFALRDPVNHYTIVTAQKDNFRTSLENKIAKSSIITLVFAIPILWLFILYVINYLLNYLRYISDEAKRHSPGRFVPIDINLVPKEIKPLINALNSVFNNLEEVLKREKNFAEDAGHELQTPLAAIKVYSQVALSANDEKERKIALQSILQSTDRSAHSVHQLLVLSRILANVYSIEIENVDLNREIAEVIAEFTPFALSKNIDIELIATTKQHQVIKASTNAIHILLENLIDNAVRYTQENDVVRVSVAAEGKNVVVRIIDNGPGIPSGLKEKVFDRFYRIVGTKEIGSGLGLSIVRQIANLYNAQVRLKTPFSGVGLEVEVVFSNKV